MSEIDDLNAKIREWEKNKVAYRNAIVSVNGLLPYLNDANENIINFEQKIKVDFLINDIGAKISDVLSIKTLIIDAKKKMGETIQGMEKSIRDLDSSISSANARIEAIKREEAARAAAAAAAKKSSSSSSKSFTLDATTKKFLLKNGINPNSIKNAKQLEEALKKCR